VSRLLLLPRRCCVEESMRPVQVEEHIIERSKQRDGKDQHTAPDPVGRSLVFVSSRATRPDPTRVRAMGFFSPTSHHPRFFPSPRTAQQTASSSGCAVPLPLARHRHRGLDSDPPAVHHSSSQSPYFNPRRSLTAIAYRTAQTPSAGEEKQR
jgi:hypothetical protein